LYVPSSYDPRQATPLVISMHGAGLWGAAQKEISLWNSAADAHGFIVVYPSGARASRVRIWHTEPGPRLIDDVRFISAIIDTLEAQYNIDRTRIYANGVSNGGGMSFVLSCTMSDRIAAVGLVAAAQTLPWKWCRDTRPIPMIWFHGTADPVVPYDGGTSWVSSRAFPSTPRFVANWARRNRCAATPVESAVAADVTRREYTQCADSASVVLYTIRGGGHTWPGGKALPESWTGVTSRSIDATKVMWAFYLAHPMSPGSH
jgi:polyhydroxybutyrate depolymerase